MDVHAKLAGIRRAVEGARSMPMSASAVVNRAELLAMLDDLELGLTESLRDADRITSERDAVVAEGRQEAEQILRDAHHERERIMSDTEVFRVAKRQADAVVVEAQTEASELRKETDEYVDGKLAHFEITLERTREAVRRGRDRLAGRTAFDALVDADAARAPLPEHLEGHLDAER